MNDTAGKIIIDGNAACALGAMFAGVTVVTWYPITPSSSLVESLIGYCRRFRNDPETGKATYAIVQAEDELASIGMALGAGWAGARSMTATAGPGISLMSEFVGLGYYAEIPAVIFNVERVGPSTGLPDPHRTGRHHHHRAAFPRRYPHPMFFPCSPEECFSHGHRRLRFRRAVPDPRLRHDRSRPGHEQLDGRFRSSIPRSRSAAAKCSTRKTSTKLGGFARYKDVDGDGVGYRTLPGTNHPAAAYFTRGSGHNDKAQYTEREDDYIHNMDRLAHKFEVMRQHVPEPIVQVRDNARIGFVAVGTSDYAVRESCDQLREEYEIEASYLRLKAYPFTHHLIDFIRRHDRVYVVDQNRDAQLLGLMRLEFDAELIAKLRSVRYYGGLPLDARTVTDEIVKQEGK